MTAYESALKDLISAFSQDDADAWDRAALRMQNLPANLVCEILQDYKRPGWPEGAVESPGVNHLMEMGTAEFLELHAAGERMHSDRLRLTMREAHSELHAPAPVAPAPRAAPAAAVPAADFGPGV